MRAAMGRTRDRLRRVSQSRAGRMTLLTAYYLGIILGLAEIYGLHHPPLPPFIYQGF
jgi:hypothetical protein